MIAKKELKSSKTIYIYNNKVYNSSMEKDITGNRDASYSNWHRETLPKKHTLIDDDLHDLNDSFVYQMYYGWDAEGDLKPKVKFETKGIIKDLNDKFILPDMSRHKTQIKALRGEAKGCNIPAFMVLYYITEAVKFFVIIPLNLRAKDYFTKYKIYDLYYIASEKQYIGLLREITGMEFKNPGTHIQVKNLQFKDFLFQQTLHDLNLFK